MILLEQYSKCYFEIPYHTLHSEMIQNYGQQRNENLTENVKARISSTSAEYLFHTMIGALEYRWS